MRALPFAVGATFFSLPDRPVRMAVREHAPDVLRAGDLLLALLLGWIVIRDPSQ
jgi:hypothetical protein